VNSFAKSVGEKGSGPGTSCGEPIWSFRRQNETRVLSLIPARCELIPNGVVLVKSRLAFGHSINPISTNGSYVNQHCSWEKTAPGSKRSRPTGAERRCWSCKLGSMLQPT
jgi:hypothetical protein